MNTGTRIEHVEISTWFSSHGGFFLAFPRTVSRWWLFVALVIGIAAISTGSYVLMHRQVVDETSQWLEGYSADVSFTDFRDSSKSYHGKVFSNVLSQPREFRIDMIFPDRTRIEIWRQDPSTFLVLDPRSKTYWLPTTQAALKLASPEGTSAASSVKTLVGRERVNGRLADHWEVTSIQGVVEQYWEDTRLHVIVKSVKPGASMYELTNIQEGRQRDELFMVPQEYKKVVAVSN
ncbi:MAG: hypothetical protein ACXVZX_04480 [Terriglobales bacterium]